MTDRNVGPTLGDAMREIRSQFVVATGWALLMAMMISCQPGANPDRALLTKPADKLTDRELSRMAAVVSTNYGSFKIALHPEWAPKTCRNFVKLVQAGFYDGLTFNEIIPGVWIRGGDPKGDGSGGPGYFVKLESPSGPHSRGAVGLYHPNMLPDQGGSQFYLVLNNMWDLDGGFTIFGTVTEGMATVERIGNLAVTPKDGKPRPFMPLTPVLIKDIKLELTR